MGITKKCADTKNWPGCHKDKVLADFTKKEVKSDGSIRYGTLCKECHCEQEKQRYIYNIDVERSKERQAYAEKMKLIENDSILIEQYNKANRKKYKTRMVKLKNDPLLHATYLEKRRKAHEKDRKKDRITSNKRNKIKYTTDILYKLRQIIGRSIRYGLEYNGTKKGGKSSWKHLGYTKQELKQHLESLFEPWMTWNNHGKYNAKIWDNNDSCTWTWQIDHIIPHSEFKYTSIGSQEFRNCWALSNLRPLSAKQNWLDGITKIRHNGTEKAA